MPSIIRAAVVIRQLSPDRDDIPPDDAGRGIGEPVRELGVGGQERAGRRWRRRAGRPLQSAAVSPSRSKTVGRPSGSRRVVTVPRVLFSRSVRHSARWTSSSSTVERSRSGDTGRPGSRTTRPFTETRPASTSACASDRDDARASTAHGQAAHGQDQASQGASLFNSQLPTSNFQGEWPDGWGGKLTNQLVDSSFTRSFGPSLLGSW